VGLADEAKRKLQDAAGGVRGARGEGAEDDERDRPEEAEFEPEEVRRRKKPKDDLPQPRDFRPES
jgi:hypothetical protein